jgi:hypothetical protein
LRASATLDPHKLSPRRELGRSPFHERPSRALPDPEDVPASSPGRPPVGPAVNDGPAIRPLRFRPVWLGGQPRSSTSNPQAPLSHGGASYGGGRVGLPDRIGLRRVRCHLCQGRPSQISLQEGYVRPWHVHRYWYVRFGPLLKPQRHPVSFGQTASCPTLPRCGLWPATSANGSSEGFRARA